MVKEQGRPVSPGGRSRKSSGDLAASGKRGGAAVVLGMIGGSTRPLPQTLWDWPGPRIHRPKKMRTRSPMHRENRPQTLRPRNRSRRPRSPSPSVIVSSSGTAPLKIPTFPTGSRNTASAYARHKKTNAKSSRARPNEIADLPANDLHGTQAALSGQIRRNDECRATVRQVPDEEYGEHCTVQDVRRPHDLVQGPARPKAVDSESECRPTAQRV